jgi:hypothetical protein
LFDIAWKNVSGDEGVDENGQEDDSGQEIVPVDSDDRLGDNGTTDEDKTKEVGP